MFKSSTGISHVDCADAYLKAGMAQRSSQRARGPAVDQTPYVRQVPCPYCRAEVGKPCVRVNGRPRSNYHQGRWQQLEAQGLRP